MKDRLMLTGPEKYLERLASIAARMTGATGAFVAITVGTRTVVVASYRLAVTPGRLPPWQDSLLSDVLTSGAPATLYGAGASAGIPDAQSVLALPLIDGAVGVIGALCVVDTAERIWSHAQVDVARDITASALRELSLIDALRSVEPQQEERRAILEAVGVGICGIDLVGRLRFVNPHAAQLLGRAVSDLPGRSLWELLFGQDGAAVSPGLTVLDEWEAGDGGTRRHMCDIRRPDGSAIHAQLSASLIREEGAIAGAVVSILDVTAQYEAETLLRESEERYRLLVELLPSALLVCIDERITFANAAAARLLGVTMPGTIVGHRLSEVISVETCAALRAQLQSGESWNGASDPAFIETEVISTNGTRVPVAIAAVPFMLQSRNALQVVIRDLTQLKAAAMAMEHSNEQLRQAQKIEAVGRLAGGVAHDFNNILTAIRGFAGLLRPIIENDTSASSYLDEIQSAADRAASLTRHLLAFSRKQVLNPVVLDVNDAIRSKVQLIDQVLGEEIELQLELNPRPCYVRVDAGQLEQVLMNLIVNARDAMESSGNLTIQTVATSLDESDSAGRFLLVPGPYVLITISDTGCGMDAATLDRIFEPFFTTKPASQGTGLGMSMVYGIVKQSGGFVWVYSEPGEGTSIEIYLPQVEIEEDAHSTAPEPAVEQQPQQAASHTILLVEDEPSVRLLARTVLEHHGHEVMEAPNGEIALELARSLEQPVDLVLTDVVMPNMNGRELAMRLTEMWPNLKVVYMSGYAEQAIARHGILEEGCVLLPKPFSPQDLIRQVHAALTA